MNGVIYKWTCNLNGKSYIGQTTNEKEREKKFLCKSKKYGGKKIENARKKYGLEEGIWTKTVLKRLWCKDKNKDKFIKRMNFWEKYYIEHFDTFNNGYNSTTGGDNQYHITDDVKKILSEKAKKQMENITDEEIKLLLNESIKYHAKNKNHVTIEVSKAISNGQKKYHEENKGLKKHITITKPTSRQIYKLDDDDNILEIYQSIKEASIKNNTYSNGIRWVCQGKFKKSNGFRWSYAKDYDALPQKPKGYSWYKRLNRWRARVKIKQKDYTLGYFKKEETAKAIYEIAQKHIKDNTFDEWYANIIDEKYKLMKKMGEI